MEFIIQEKNYNKHLTKKELFLLNKVKKCLRCKENYTLAGKYCAECVQISFLERGKCLNCGNNRTHNHRNYCYNCMYTNFNYGIAKKICDMYFEKCSCASYGCAKCGKLIVGELSHIKCEQCIEEEILFAKLKNEK